MLATEKEFLYSRLQFLIEKYSSWMKMKDPQENDEHFGNLHEIRQDMEKLKEYLESVPAETLVSQPSELLPCPFCGERVKFRREVSYVNGKTMWQISCRNKGCEINPSTDLYIAKKECLTDWNKRASQ